MPPTDDREVAVREGNVVIEGWSEGSPRPLILTEPALRELHELVKLAYSMYQGERYTFSAVEQSLQWTRKRAHRTGTVVLGINQEKALVGTLSLLPYSAAKHNAYVELATDVCLEQFAVHPNYQRRGMGRKLMDVAEDLIRRSLGRRVFLDTPSEASHLRRFYESLRYHDVGAYQPFGDGQENTIYCKELES